MELWQKRNLGRGDADRDLLSPYNACQQSNSANSASAVCGSAWKKDPGSGVIGVEKGPLVFFSAIALAATVIFWL